MLGVKMSYQRDIPLWISEDEWRLVYAWLYSDNVDMAKRGCARVQAWKARSMLPAIPFPIENTAELVECRVSEATTTITEPFLQQAYAMAITRFVNGVCEYRYDQCKVKEAVFVALHAMSVPSWIVTVRHSATHVTMPSLTLLKAAAEFAMKWLKENYWEEQINLISAAQQQHDNSTEATRSLSYIRIKEHWENLSIKAVGKTKGKKKKAKTLPNAIASELAAMSKKELTELIRDGSFLVPNSSYFPTPGQLFLFELEDPAADQVEMFPVLHNEINKMWSRPLRSIHSNNPSCISTILVILAEEVHDSSLSRFMLSYMAAWLGELLGDHYLDITKGVNWEELLKASYSKPGPYSYAIMKVAGENLSAVSHPFVFSDQYSLLLESTRLLSAAERILPTLKPKGSYIYGPQDDYAINVNKLIKETEEQSTKPSKSDTTNPWKKSNALVHWLQVPVGLAPSQTLTATTLELPVQLDDEPTTPQNTGQFTPRLDTSVLRSPMLETAIVRKRKFDQSELSKIHTYSDTIAKI